MSTFLFALQSYKLLQPLIFTCRVIDSGNLSFFLVELQNLATFLLALQSYNLQQIFIHCSVELQTLANLFSFMFPYRVTDSGKILQNPYIDHNIYWLMSHSLIQIHTLLFFLDNYHRLVSATLLCSFWIITIYWLMPHSFTLFI